jgi:hypothetical protein
MIGWDQFFRGRIAKACWRIPIGMYYKIRQPGESFTPDQWMRTVIKELWVFSIAIWNNGGKKQRPRLLWQCTRLPAIGNVSQTDSVVLHHARIDEILKWTKEHLDAYLASADVIIDQCDEQG